MGQTGPREIGANLAFGVNLALFILQCVEEASRTINRTRGSSDNDPLINKDRN